MLERSSTYIHEKTAPPTCVQGCPRLQHPSSLNSSVVGITTKPKERLLRALTMEHYWILSRNSLSFWTADSSLCARGQYPWVWLGLMVLIPRKSLTDDTHMDLHVFFQQNLPNSRLMGLGCSLGPVGLIWSGPYYCIKSNAAIKQY